MRTTLGALLVLASLAASACAGSIKAPGPQPPAGLYTFDCSAFAQPHDDCMFLPLDHAELYTRFAEVWPDVRAFIRSGRFSPTADRTPPEKTR